MFETYLPVLQLHLFTLALLGLGSIVTLSTVFLNKQVNVSPHAYSLYRIKPVLNFIVEIIRSPLLFLISVYAVYFVYLGFKQEDLNLPIFQSLNNLLHIAELVTGFWMLFNTLNVTKARLLVWSKQKNHPTLNLIVPNIELMLSCILMITMINTLLSLVAIEGGIGYILYKVVKILFIAMVGFCCYQLVNIAEKVIITQYIANNKNVFYARKINTQLLIFKRFIISIIMVITIAAILMLFEAVNNVGKGLLTTAGIVSAIGAFASHESLSRIFSGLQIAFSQPVRIGDTVIVENEFGQVEEITLLYIVVKLWDLRRLILPTDYFTNKGVQNLTHDSSQLLGTAFIYCDYTLPVDEIRKKYLSLLAESPLWDKKVGALQVTNITEKSLELRALMSAEDASKLWDLRCWVREHIMKYIVEHYPESLSKARNMTKTQQIAS